MKNRVLFNFIRTRKEQKTGRLIVIAVASEIYKQIKTWRLPIDMYHLRSLDGREIDVLLECERDSSQLRLSRPKTSARQTPDI